LYVKYFVDFSYYKSKKKKYQEKLSDKFLDISTFSHIYIICVTISQNSWCINDGQDIQKACPTDW